MRVVFALVGLGIIVGCAMMALSYHYFLVFLLALIVVNVVWCYSEEYFESPAAYNQDVFSRTVRFLKTSIVKGFISAIVAALSLILFGVVMCILAITVSVALVLTGLKRKP